MQLTPKVLVVDDDAVVGRSFDRVLSRKGFEVTTARDGQEALKRLETDDYDAVFTDIKMPGMDGIEVAERIKDRRPWTPVVIVTGYGTAANRARAEAVGVDDFVHKPLSPEMIEGIAENALRVVKDPGPPEVLEVAAEAPAVVAEKVSALRKIARFSKNVGLLFAAPFVGLAYAIVFPLFGLGMLVWLGVQAVRSRVS